MAKASNNKTKDPFSSDDPFDTCISLKFSEEIACSVCKPATDKLTHRRKKKKTERCKSERRQCKRLWEQCLKSIDSLTDGKIKNGRIQANLLSQKKFMV